MMLLFFSGMLASFTIFILMLTFAKKFDIQIYFTDESWIKWKYPPNE